MTNRIQTMLLGAAVLACLSCSGAATQAAEPTYKADPDVYKVIYEDEHLRLIEGVRKAGVTDKLHGHPVPFVIYSATDCETNQTADGKSVQSNSKAGAVRALPAVAGHTATNTGKTDCRQLFIERK